MISVVILTWNEAGNLGRCLRSVAWSDDVLVLDSGSTDGTQDLARTAGARVLERAFDSFAGQRNFAMDSGGLRHRWVLHLDADEVLTEELRKEILAIAGDPEPPFPVYRVPSRLIFMGRWLRHAGMYPSYQVRFGLHDQLRFVDYGHGQREVQAPHLVGTLVAPLEHFNFSKGISHWVGRHLRYARAEAEQSLADRRHPVFWRHLFSADPTCRRRTLKRIAYRLPFRALLRFMYVFFLRGGFLDGRAGFHYAVLMGFYQYLIGTYEREMEPPKGANP